MARSLLVWGGCKGGGQEGARGGGEGEGGGGGAGGLDRVRG